MSNPYGAPGISVQEFAAKIAGDEKLILIDVREHNERQWANIDHAIPAVEHIPLSAFNPYGGTDTLPAAIQDPQENIVVMCHHGNRSAQFALWLIGQGYVNVLNLDGGIEAWAINIDPNIGRY